MVLRRGFPGARVCVPEPLSKQIKQLSDVHAVDPKNKWTPLHLACHKGFPECVRILLEKSALPDAVNAQGETSLHLAAKKGIAESVQLLLSRSCMCTCARACV